MSNQRNDSFPMAQMMPTAELEGPYLKADVMALTGELAGRRYVLTDELVIGRDPNVAVHIPGNDVSRRHARVIRTNAGHYVLEDLQSRNGTMVNGKPIEMHVLQFGDRFQVGARTLFVLTNHQALEEQLVRWQRIELIAEMSAGLVHDFNNYMAAVLGYIQYLEHLCEKNTPLERLKELLDEALPTMRTAAEEGSNLARKVLGFARGTNQRSYTRIDLGRLTNEAVRVVSHNLSENVVIETAVEPLLVTADETELLQVLINLMLNARDAMPEGGTITIEGKTEALTDDQADNFEMPIGEELVAIKVRDTGVGMDAATRKRIFEPLFTTKEKGKGTGLGLSMVARIVENHGGEIRVDSEQGKGTVFTIYLPTVTPLQDHALLAAGDTQLLEGTAHEPAADSERDVVLLVGVGEKMRQRAARAVYALGHDFLFCPDPKDAPDLLEKYRDRISLVIVNADAPQIVPPADGDGTISAELKAINPKLRVLFTTARGKNHERLSVELQRILRLPCDSRDFQAALQDALK